MADIPATIEYPYRLLCHANARRHWRVEAQAKKAEKAALRYAWAEWRARSSLAPLPFPLRVTMTRIAPRVLDDDNLQGAFKYTRDEIARCLGLASDCGPEVVWCYAQERGPPKTYAVRITLETLAPSSAPDAPLAPRT